VQRAVAWLLERQDAAGCWAEPEFTGTGFPQVFYLRYHYYPIYFPLQALARNLVDDVAGNDRAVARHSVARRADTAGIDAACTDAGIGETRGVSTQEVV
jgi:hypothetical protein